MMNFRLDFDLRRFKVKFKVDLKWNGYPDIDMKMEGITDEMEGE